MQKEIKRQKYTLPFRYSYLFRYSLFQLAIIAEYAPDEKDRFWALYCMRQQINPLNDFDHIYYLLVSSTDERIEIFRKEYPKIKKREQQYNAIAYRVLKFQRWIGIKPQKQINIRQKLYEKRRERRRVHRM